MTNTPDNIEELLEHGKTLVLSEAEHEEMKSALRSYAGYHGGRERSVDAHRSWFGMYALRSAVVVAGVLVVFVGTGYASLESLPGDALYGTKVNIVEEVVGAFQVSEQEKLEYSVERMEKRLDELRILEAKELLTPERITEVEKSIGSHVADLNAVLAEDTDGSLEQDAVVTATGDAAAAVEAMERILDMQDTVPDSSFDDATNETSELHETEIEDLMESGDTELIRSFIGSRLEEIREDLLLLGDASSTLQEAVDVGLVDIEAALGTNDLETAVRLINELSLRLDIIEYIEEPVDAAVEGDRATRTPGHETEDDTE